MVTKQKSLECSLLIIMNIVSVWEFYHYRREVMASKFPNPAHHAIAECQKWMEKGKIFSSVDALQGPFLFVCHLWVTVINMESLD